MAYNPKDKNPSGVVLFGNNGSDQVFESVTDFVYDTGNTRLGINTSSPQYTLDVSGTGTFHTIRFADGTEMITSGAGGGMTSWDLSVTGDSVTITDGATVTFTGQGSITTTRNANTVIISGTAGGSDPTGTASGVAFFGDDNNLTESSKLVFTSGGRGELNIDNQTGIINITEIETTGSAITLDYGTAQLVRFVEGNFSDPIMVSFRNNGFGFRDGNPAIFSSTTSAAVAWQGGFWGPWTNGGVDHGSSSKRWQDYYGYRMDLDNDTASSIVLKVQGAASQSANLQEWRNSTSVAQAHVDATGGISGTSYTFADGTIQTTAAAGGGTPGGSVNQIQINDGAGGFTTATNSDRFVYDDSTNTFDLGRQSADNVAGGQFTNYWFANNFCVGGGNFSATMDSDANNNTAVGIDALGALTFGDDNVAIGYQAGDALTASDDNTIIGSQAGSAFGNNINDNRNVIIGYQAANAAIDIASNVIIGYQAGSSANGPDGSVIIGAGAGFDSDADYNVLIGYECGYKADGNYNIYIGKPQSAAVGAPNVTGSGNLILGWNFDYQNNSIYGNPNGYSATASQQFAIANSLVGDFSAQRIGVGEAAINALDATLHVIPQNSSDVVLKVQGTASQSANLQEWRNSSDTELASVGPSGRLYYQSSYSPISDEGTASSFTFDLDTSNVFSGTLSAASTLATSNGDVGQRFLVRLKQGSGGSKTVSSWFNGRVSWPGGSAPTLSSTEGHVDLFGFLVTSGTAPTLYYDGFTIATGIQ